LSCRSKTELNSLNRQADEVDAAQQAAAKAN